MQVPASFFMQICRETDIIAQRMISSGGLIVDDKTGAIVLPDGTRAERLHRATGAGRVQLEPYRRIWAHRLVWIATHGVPSADTLILHINGLRCDNRPENLTTRIKHVKTGKLAPYEGCT